MSRCCKCFRDSRFTYKNMPYCVFHLPVAKKYDEEFNDETFVKVGPLTSHKDVKEIFVSLFQKYVRDFTSQPPLEGSEFSVEDFIFPEMPLSEWASLWTDLAAERVPMFTGMIPLKLNSFFNARNATFYCDALFKGYFLMGASFSNARFESNAVFQDVTFKDPTFPTGNNLEEATEFIETIFKGKVFFSRVHFYDGVSFSRAEFHKRAEFFWPMFFGKSDGTISDDLNPQAAFIGTIFKDTVLFRNPILAPAVECSFMWGHFYSNLLIESPAFAESAILTFKGVTFRDSFKISEACKIYKWPFKEGKTNIRHLSFIENPAGTYYEWRPYEKKDREKEPIAPHIKLQRLTLIENAIVIIDNTPIDNFSFFKTSLMSERNRIELPNEPLLNKNLTKLQDENEPECAKEKEKTTTSSRLLKCIKKFCESRSKKESEKDDRIFDYKELERIARELRTALERKGKYVDAGIFFKLEMNYRTPQLCKWKTCAWYLFHKMYSWVDYGESIGKALRWFIYLILLGSVVHLFNGYYLNKGFLKYYLQTSSFCSDFTHEISSSSIYTIQNMLFILSDKYKAISLNLVGESINILLKVMAVIMIAILGIAIRRKMKRMLVD